MAGHSWWRMLIIIVAVLAFLAALVMNGLNLLLDYYDPGLFDSSTMNVTANHPTVISPAEWTFAIWGAIYMYQLIFVLYALSTVCNKTDDGYLYCDPAILCTSVYVFYILTMGCNLALLFMWDVENLEASLGLTAGTALTLYLSIAIAMHGIASNAGELLRQGKKMQLVCAIAIVLNGLALYAAWASIDTLLKLAVVLEEVFDFPEATCGAIALSALALDILVYALIDLVLFERHFRHVYTPYLALAVALVGSIWVNWDLDDLNTVFTVCVACMGTILFIVKIVMSIVRSRTDPLFSGLDEKGV